MGVRVTFKCVCVWVIIGESDGDGISGCRWGELSSLCPSMVVVGGGVVQAGLAPRGPKDTGKLP